MRNKLEDTNMIVGLIIIFALLFFCAGVGIYQKFLPVITLKVDSVTIRQDESLPEIKAYAEFSGKKNVILDEESNYSVNDLVEELNRGKGSCLTYQVDPTKEGTYGMQLEWEDAVKEKLVFSWNYKVRYRIEAGTIQVLNKYGDWEDGKFKFLDGTYASGWTNLGEDTYYFGENGKSVAGEQNIDGNVYYFHENGIFDVKRNKINPARPMVALTYDDGPSGFTMKLLEQLEAYNARATFFMVGTNVSKYPDVVKRMAEIGCELGNHTTNHARLTLQPTEGVVHEIQTTNERIRNLVKQDRIMVRPPYGAVNETVQNLANAPLAMWSVDTRDWEWKNADMVSNYVLDIVRDGDVILLHDIHETTIQASLDFIPKLIEKGYQLVTMSEMAKVRGVNLENGVKYYHFRK